MKRIHSAEQEQSPQNKAEKEARIPLWKKIGVIAVLALATTEIGIELTQDDPTPEEIASQYSVAEAVVEKGDTPTEIIIEQLESRGIDPDTVNLNELRWAFGKINPMDKVLHPGEIVDVPLPLDLSSGAEQ